VRTESEPKEVLLYILLEHQSTVDHSIAFRVLAYLVNIWEDIYKILQELYPILHREFKVKRIGFFCQKSALALCFFICLNFLKEG